MHDLADGGGGKSNGRDGNKNDRQLNVIEKEEAYSYNGKDNLSSTELYTEILIDEAATQFGIKDLVALGAAIDNFGFVEKPFVTPGSSKNTSLASKYGGKLLPQKLPGKLRLPTHFNTRTGKWAFTRVLGRFLGRMAGPVGWAVLTYDIGKTLYNTQVKYNEILNHGK